MYVIWSFEHSAWWRPNRAGYTERVGEAGVYTWAETRDICYNPVAVQEMAVPCDFAYKNGPPRHPYPFAPG